MGDPIYFKRNFGPATRRPISTIESFSSRAFQTSDPRIDLRIYQEKEEATPGQNSNGRTSQPKRSQT